MIDVELEHGDFIFIFLFFIGIELEYDDEIDLLINIFSSFPFRKVNNYEFRNLRL